MQSLWEEAVKGGVEAAVGGIVKALGPLFGGGRERRIAYAKERVAPIERFVAATRL